MCYEHWTHKVRKLLEAHALEAELKTKCRTRERRTRNRNRNRNDLNTEKEAEKKGTLKLNVVNKVTYNSRMLNIVLWRCCKSILNSENLLLNNCVVM